MCSCIDLIMDAMFWHNAYLKLQPLQRGFFWKLLKLEPDPKPYFGLGSPNLNAYSYGSQTIIGSQNTHIILLVPL